MFTVKPTDTLVITLDELLKELLPEQDGVLSKEALAKASGFFKTKLEEFNNNSIMKSVLNKLKMQDGDIAEDLKKEVIVEQMNDLRRYLIAKNTLQEALQSRVAAGKAMPIPQELITRVEPLYWFQVASNLLSTATTSEAIKAIDAEVTSQNELIGKFVQFLSSSAKETTAMVTRADKKITTVAAAQQKSESRAADKEKKKMSAIKTKQGSEAAFPLFALSHPAIKEMEYIDALNMKSSVQAGTPYKIKAHQPLTALCESRVVKASMGIFRIQFTSNVAKKGGVLQTPFHNEKAPNVRELLLETGPSTAITASKKYSGQLCDKQTSAISMFAANVGYKGTSLERQGLPSLRYQVQGQREIIVTEFAALYEYIMKLGMEHKGKDDESEFFEWCAEAFQDMSTTDQLDVFKAEGGTMYKTTVREGDVVVLPSGYFTMERTLGDQTVFGYRTSYFDTAGMENFSMMLKCKMAADGKDSPIVKFWEQLLECLNDAKKNEKASAASS